ncbi:hypothetical protein KSC_011530 [Ktedonobacter sp. SOSP1-52]|uniref:GNAT family N-acetyltransferase n=1 Tax=Ktedonobacter sp. SOSP1-52 TaxID=2778366 RepID=UPI001916828D|nr:GNAT family N-acetyltransferase [Ktedonobacter sp. SOSP1-52]GHO62261.1 hypothetical protein KSC_011530 [Ktedonobacter sp. SOSP1-52]
MFTILTPPAFERVKPLFADMAYHLAIVTVLAGKTPGQVYVDDSEAPQTALLLPTNPHRIYLAGRAGHSDLQQTIQAILAQKYHELSPGADGYGALLYYPPGDENWQALINTVFQGQEIFKGQREFHCLKLPHTIVSSPLPEGFVLRRLDEKLLQELEPTNRAHVLEEICSESPSLEHFLTYNFGLCAQREHTLAGWCLAEYRDQERCELGIETQEDYQRQGIATALAQAVIKQAFVEGATEIGWHCWARNTASVATAKKLGFEKAFDYPVYYCQYRQEA